MAQEVTPSQTRADLQPPNMVTDLFQIHWKPILSSLVALVVVIRTTLGVVMTIPDAVTDDPRPLLLTWINFGPSMYKQKEPIMWATLLQLFSLNKPYNLQRRC